MDRYRSNLVWIDLEMTGLNPEIDTILEISTLITNNNLDIIACGPSLVINHSPIVIAGMDEWNTTHHTASGLVQEVLHSNISLVHAADATFEFIKQYSPPGVAPLCGNSIWQDRIFLRKYMPLVDAYLNYRIIDVSSIKEVVRRWYWQIPERKYQKPENHRACQDIHESIEELKHYRKYFFIPLAE